MTDWITHTSRETNSTLSKSLSKGVTVSHPASHKCDDCESMAYEAIQRVRELHKPVDIDDLGSWIVCEGCSNQFIDDEAPYVNYPCATIKALDGETE